MKFSQLGLINPLLRAVTKAGHASPTPIQALSIPEALTGKDVLGAAEAGTGKTAAFALPVLQRLLESSPPRHPLSRRVRALIITATRDLAIKVGDRFAAYGKYVDLNCHTLADPEDAVSFAHGLRTVEILITTPERLIELHNTGGVDLRAVEILVLDEADRMLAMSSLPDIQRIISQLPLDRQTLLFSATLPTAINSLADSILRNPARIRIPPTQKAADAVHQSVCFVNRPQKTSMLVGWLGQHASSRTVVFTRTSLGADRVVRQLLSCGIRAEAIHGEKSTLARQQTLSRFRSNQPPVLVATDLAARGIDVDSILQVVNYDLPLEPETYVHRIGRISRGGTKGHSVAFCDDSERPLLKGIERLLRRTIPVDEKTSPTDRSLPSDEDSQFASESPAAPATTSRRPSPGRSTSTEKVTGSIARTRKAPSSKDASTARPSRKEKPQKAAAGRVTAASSTKGKTSTAKPAAASKSGKSGLRAESQSSKTSSAKKNRGASTGSRSAKTKQEQATPRRTVASRRR